MILCTDDCHSGTLVNDGHMNRVVRHAIECGCDPLIALQMATINTATHFGLERDIGSLTPGRRADVILTSDLKICLSNMLLRAAKQSLSTAKITVDCPHLTGPKARAHTVHMGKTLTEPTLKSQAPKWRNSVTANVIGVVENQAPTKALEGDLPVRDGCVQTDGDVCQIALVERHSATGGVVNGFVSGFGYTGPMAMASTVAHDSHHMIVVGTDRAKWPLPRTVWRGRRRDHLFKDDGSNWRWSNCPLPA